MRKREVLAGVGELDQCVFPGIHKPEAVFQNVTMETLPPATLVDIILRL
jgi:hypothetical protein